MSRCSTGGLLDSIRSTSETSERKEIIKMKTVVFEIYPNDDYTCPTKFVKYNVHCDADIDDLIIMLSEQGFHVADVYDEADFD